MMVNSAISPNDASLVLESLVGKEPTRKLCDFLQHVVGVTHNSLVDSSIDDSTSVRQYNILSRQVQDDQVPPTVYST